MPVTKSAKKNVLKNIQRRKINTARKSAIKSAVKNVQNALEVSDLGHLETLMRQAESKLAHAKKKGVLHKRTAARKISRLAKKVAKAKRDKAQK